jgi:hypothetical protein
MTDVKHLKVFVNATGEFLGFIETAVVANGVPVVTAGGAVAEKGSNVEGFWMNYDIQQAIQVLLQHRHRNKALYDSPLPAQQQQWPETQDVFLHTMLVQFVLLSQGGGFPGMLVNSPLLSSPSPSAPQGVPGLGHRGPVLWSPAAVSQHAAMCWALYLRTACCLRGLRPGAILGGDIQADLSRFAARGEDGVRAVLEVFGVDCGGAGAGAGIGGGVTGGGASTVTATSGATVSASIQLEFIDQCLQQLVQERQQTGAVYLLAKKWINAAAATATATACQPSSSSSGGGGGGEGGGPSMLSLEAVRLLHLRQLLEAGGGTRDEEVEQLAVQVPYVLCPRSLLCLVFNLCLLTICYIVTDLACVGMLTYFPCKRVLCRVVSCRAVLCGTVLWCR